MAVALQTATELTLQEKLNEKLSTVFRVPGYEANLVRGHEAALRIIDAGSYVCLCCPPALCNNGLGAGTAPQGCVPCVLGGRPKPLICYLHLPDVSLCSL